MPEGEELFKLAATGATLAIHLSIRNLRFIRREIEPYYGLKCPVGIIYRACWPEQKIIKTNIENMVDATRREKITRTALILVGSVLANQDFEDSALYDPTKPHLLRNKKT